MAEYDGDVIAVLGPSPAAPVNYYLDPDPAINPTREAGEGYGPSKALGIDRERPGGVAEIALGAGDYISNYWSDPVLTPRYESSPAAAIAFGELRPNYYWHPDPAINPVREARRLLHDQQFISLNPDMLPIGGSFVFKRSYDSLGLVQESYHLTQHKPWQAHQDSITLVEESYRLTVISGWPSTPPRHVSMVRHPEGALVEWDPPADRGSAPIQEYRLYRGLSAGSMELIATPGGDARHHFDAGAPEGSIYKLYAFNGVLESDPTFALEIIDPDTERISLRDALTGEAWAGLPYAGWLGVRAIRLTPSAITILPSGRALQIEAVIYPVDATVLELAWSSSRPDIVSVDQDGIVTAHAPGRAVITAMATDGTEISARVPIISMPKLMVDDIADRLLELGFTQVFKRFSPDLPDRAIVLRQLSGEAPEAALPIDRPALAVAVRARDLGEAQRMLKEVHDALHMCTPMQVNGTHYYAIEALSTGQYEDKDRRGPRYICTATFRTERERRLGGSP